MCATNAGVLPSVAAVAVGVDRLCAQAETDSSSGGTFLGSVVVSQVLTAVAVPLGQIEVCGACVRIDVDCRVDPLTVVKREFCLPDEENNMKDDMKKRSRNYVLEILHLYLFLEASIQPLNIK